MIKPENIRIVKIYDKTNAHEAKHLLGSFIICDTMRIQNGQKIEPYNINILDNILDEAFVIDNRVFSYIAELEYVPDEPIGPLAFTATYKALEKQNAELKEELEKRKRGIDMVMESNAIAMKKIAELTQYKTWAEIELKRWHEQHEQLQGLHKGLYDENKELKEKVTLIKKDWVYCKEQADSRAKEINILNNKLIDKRRDEKHWENLYRELVAQQPEPDIYFFGNVEQGARKYEGHEMEFLDFEGNWKKEILIKICSSSELKNIGIEDETCVFQVKDLRPLGVSVYQFMRPIKAGESSPDLAEDVCAPKGIKLEQVLSTTELKDKLNVFLGPYVGTDGDKRLRELFRCLIEHIEKQTEEIRKLITHDVLNGIAINENFKRIEALEKR